MSELTVVFGATGGIGRRVVEGLEQRGLPVLAAVRQPKAAASVLGADIPIAAADVRYPETLPAALQGASRLVCATGSRSPLGANEPQRVDYEGVANLVQAALAAGIEHFVLVSSIAVTRANHPLNAFGKVLTWKLRGEDSLRASGLTYTIIRPGGLTDGPSGDPLQFGQGDRMMGMVSRADIAEVCLQAFAFPSACNTTFEVIQAQGTPGLNWATLFGSLMPDRAL